MAISLVPILYGIVSGATAAFNVVKEVVSTIISLIPTPLKWILFLFVIFFMGGGISVYMYGAFTDYSCQVVNGTTYVYDITNPNAFASWNKAYFLKLYGEGRLDEYGLNETELNELANLYKVDKTTAIYGIKYYINIISGWFSEETGEFNIICYELYDNLEIDERSELGLHSNCNLSDVPEPDVIFPLITALVDKSENQFFYPICISDGKGEYSPKLSFLGFDIFDFWLLFFGFMGSLAVIGYYKWNKMLK